MKYGIIKIIGNTNVGKSTLFNKLISNKLSITSKKKNLTNYEINHNYIINNKTITYFDTPGINNKLYKINLHNVDLINFVIEVNKISTIEINLINKIKLLVPIIIIINKIDKYNLSDIFKFVNYIKTKISFDEIIPISSKKKININKLQNINQNYIHSEINTNIINTFTVENSEVLFKEIIKEKLFRYLGEEIPYNIQYINLIKKETKKNLFISADIFVKKLNYIKIIIGKNGNKIKQICFHAQLDIKKQTKKFVKLELFIKAV